VGGGAGAKQRQPWSTTSPEDRSRTGSAPPPTAPRPPPSTGCWGAPPGNRCRSRSTWGRPT